MGFEDQEDEELDEDGEADGLAILGKDCQKAGEGAEEEERTDDDLVEEVTGHEDPFCEAQDMEDVEEDEEPPHAEEGDAKEAEASEKADGLREKGNEGEEEEEDEMADDPHVDEQVEKAKESGAFKEPWVTESSV